VISILPTHLSATTWGFDMADMGWSQYIRGQEAAADLEQQARSQDMLPHLAKHCAYDSPHLMYRCYYKYTDCGPWVSVHVNGQWIHCGDLHKLGTWAEMQQRGDILDEVLIGSIVEGVDAEAGPVSVRLDDLRSRRSKAGNVTARSLRSAFSDAVSAVNAEAQQIWDETHGCDTCLAYWEAEGLPGETAVWEECPECEGGGTII
jgi:hypothetical protein